MPNKPFLWKKLSIMCWFSIICLEVKKELLPGFLRTYQNKLQEQVASSPWYCKYKQNKVQTTWWFSRSSFFSILINNQDSHSHIENDEKLVNPFNWKQRKSSKWCIHHSLHWDINPQLKYTTTPSLSCQAPPKSANCPSLLFLGNPPSILAFCD